MRYKSNVISKVKNKLRFLSVRCQSRLSNKKGSILVEALGGIAVISIVLLTYASLMVSSFKLDTEAYYETKINNQIFTKLEKGEYTVVEASSPSAFQVYAYIEPISRDEIILADGNKMSQISIGPGFTVGTVSTPLSFRILENVKFYKYKDLIPSPVSAEANVYVLKK